MSTTVSTTPTQHTATDNGFSKLKPPTKPSTATPATQPGTGHPTDVTDGPLAATFNKLALVGGLSNA